MNKEREETIKEINEMRASLNKHFGVYAANAIDRLIIARIKLESLVDEKSVSKERENLNENRDERNL